MALKPDNRHTSNQVVGTPSHVLDDVEAWYGSIGIDLAALPENAVAELYYTPEDDSLSDACPWSGFLATHEVAWCNPPFNMFRQFTTKAAATVHAEPDAAIVMLTLASLSSNWWRDNVHERAVVQPVPRIQFVGHDYPFPKDLVLLLYGRRFGAPRYLRKRAWS